MHGSVFVLELESLILSACLLISQFGGLVAQQL